MNLYVFEYIGDFAGGAALVVADTAETAKGLLEKYSKKRLKEQGFNIEPCEVLNRKYSEKLDKNRDYTFYLEKEFALKTTQKKGVVFYSCCSGWKLLEVKWKSLLLLVF